MKFNPVKTCSCKVCRQGNQRRFYFKTANRKFRHNQKLALKSFDLSKLEDVVLGKVSTGYTD